MDHDVSSITVATERNAPDERVALEFANGRHLYAARLGRANDTRIDWFVGPHTIHGVDTFKFLREKLRR